MWFNCLYIYLSCHCTPLGIVRNFTEMRSATRKSQVFILENPECRISFIQSIEINVVVIET
jgi:hypothetical protein